MRDALFAVAIIIIDVEIFKIDLGKDMMIRPDSVDDFACTGQCQAVCIALQSVQSAAW
jgi:hypothetical protein